MTRHVDVAIIGAGFSGIGAAVALDRAGRGDFLVFERAEAVGGTWRDNVYPGVACDIPSHLYGFSFMPNPEWTRRFAPGAEIRAYLEHVVASTGIADRLRFGAALLAAVWDEAAGCWRIETARGPVTAGALVLACGRLSEPRIPEVPGIASFRGPIFHSARWDTGADLSGKRVAVIGTGASAIQLAPELARDAEVTVFQRSPAWILPRDDRDYSPDERRAFAAEPERMAAERREAYLAGEAMLAQRFGDPAAVGAVRARALAHLERHVPDPATRAALTPEYEIGCKRIVFSDDFYPAVTSGAIRLEASALAAIDHGELVAASGARHEVDAVVFATGFESSRQPYADLVRGTEATLAEHWAHGMVSHASTMVAGFPNCFILDGPNASLGHNSSILMIEAQLDYLLAALEHLDARGDHRLEVTTAAEREYTRRIDEIAASTVWLSGCRSWYLDDATGRLALLWPGSVDEFREHGAAFDRSAFVPDLADALVPSV